MIALPTSDAAWRHGIVVTCTIALTEAYLHQWLRARSARPTI